MATLPTARAGALLLKRLPPCRIVLDDKGYDNDAIRRQTNATGAAPNTPPKAHCLWKLCSSPVLSGPRYSHGSDDLLWLHNGGDAALRSFEAWSMGGLPHDVIEWNRQLPTSYEDEHRYYVQAGLDPARPLTEQIDHDRIWIRGPFLKAEHDFGKHIVHGHTPQRPGMPDERRYWTNLDTAAVYGGALTAGVFTSDQDQAVAFLRVVAEEG